MADRLPAAKRILASPGDFSLKKKTKKLHREQCYKEEYSNSYSFISKSETAAHFVFCRHCKCDFSIGHGGMNDIKKHISTAKHQRFFNAVANSTPIRQFFQRHDDLAVIKAKVMYTISLVETNTPLSTADKNSKLMKVMFPDSSVVNKFACGRTKATAIVHTLAGDRVGILVKQLRTSPFSLSIDGSNDEYKLYPVVVRHYNQSIRTVTANLLSLPCLEGGSTGKNIAELVKAEFEKNNIPWRNCIAFGTDNTSSMIGCHKGCVKFLQEQHEDLAVIGCPCHLLAIAGEKAAKTLPIDVEELLVDVFYYLDIVNLGEK